MSAVEGRTDMPLKRANLHRLLQISDTNSHVQAERLPGARLLVHLANVRALPMTALRQKLPLADSKSNFRVTPESRLNSEISACPKSAKLGSR
jgi:hypothetical protein